MFLPKQVELINDTIIIPYEDKDTSRGKIFDLFITHFETTLVIDYSDNDGNLISDIIPNYHEKILELVYQANGM